jgi:8-oxo-dGTP diphosphatase
MGVPQVLETERLILRRHVRGDAAVVARLLNDWDVARWLAQVPFPYGERDAYAWITQAISHWTEGRQFQFAVIKRASTELIGQVGLRLEAPGADTAELGYWLGQAYWGRGYAGEAVPTVVRFGFERLRLRAIWATCLGDNAGSLRVLEKAGLVRRGEIEQTFAAVGGPCRVPLFRAERKASAAATVAP